MIALFALSALGGIGDVHVISAEAHWIESNARGHEIAVTRHARPGAPPVVLIHGISSNHHFWDLQPGRSLAAALWEAGYDVWNADLRGHGLAEKDHRGRKPKGAWTVDDYGSEDLPALFAHVLAATEATELHYVGHSMGGMVLAVFLAQNPGQQIVASAVVVASPLGFRDPEPTVDIMLRAASSPIGHLFPRLPTPFGSRVLASFDRDPLHLDALLLNPENYDVEARRATLRSVVSPLYRGEALQFATAASDGEFRSSDGAVIYRQALAHVAIPMLFFAGRADRIVNPDRVRGYYEAVGSSDKEFIMASRTNGFGGDYGHLDFGVADTAAQDVFPRVIGFLDRVATDDAQ